MPNTIAFVTNQYRCDRLISAAHQLTSTDDSELLVVEVLDAEYTLDPKAVDYLFMKSKEYNAAMRLLFAENKVDAMREIIAGPDTCNVVTGMPQNHNSPLYDLWREFTDKAFYTVDADGELIEVASPCLRQVI
jgi:hypothetical protein